MDFRGIVVGSVSVGGRGGGGKGIRLTEESLNEFERCSIGPRVCTLQFNAIF